MGLCLQAPQVRRSQSEASSASETGFDSRPPYMDGKETIEDEISDLENEVAVAENDLAAWQTRLADKEAELEACG